MHTIRKGEPRDIAAIAVIYDRILDREERGRASTAGSAVSIRPPTRRAPRWRRGSCSSWSARAASSWPDASTMSSARSTPPSHGRSRRRRMSRCSCCTRSCPTRSSRGTARHGVRRLLRTIRPRARLHLAPDRHERAQRLRAPPVRPPRLS